MLSHRAADPPGLDWRDIDPSYALDVSDLAARVPSCSDESEGPEACEVRADFDGDGAADLFTPILSEGFQPGFAVAWGSGEPMSVVGPSDAGHLAPATAQSECATSLQDALYGNSVRGIEDLTSGEATTIIPGPPSRDHRFGLLLPADTWLGFDGKSWRVATPERFGRDDASAWTDPWTPDTHPTQCKLARSIRRTQYKNQEVLQWHPRDQVARDACEYSLDFDRDGTLETVSWVVSGGMPGLQVVGLPGGTALFGAGRRAAVEVLDGEPGCNRAPPSLADVWDVASASWNGEAWQLEDGRSHAPAHPDLVDGPALALTNASGHVDLLFLSDGAWKTAAVPFEWERYFVLWPAMDQWNWVAKPLPWARRYDRPTPPHRSWVKKHTPGPRPKSAGRFYAGH